jgi:hypothetical protein
MMAGAMSDARRRGLVAVEYADKSHHAFVFMAQDVAVKDELAQDVFAKAH